MGLLLQMLLGMVLQQAMGWCLLLHLLQMVITIAAATAESHFLGLCWTIPEQFVRMVQVIMGLLLLLLLMH